MKIMFYRMTSSIGFPQKTTFFYRSIGHARSDHLRNLYVEKMQFHKKKVYKMSRTTFVFFMKWDT